MTLTMGIGLLLMIGGLARFAALAANREVDRYIDTELRTLPVLTNVHIYKGALVGLSGGYARGLVAGDKFAGIAYEEVDNTGGASGAVRVRVYTQGDFGHALTFASVANNKAPVYATEDQTLSLTPNGSFVGYQVDVPAANQIVLRIDTGLAQPQTVAGHQLVSVASVAAAGADQAGAAALTADINVVTAADDAKGVKLPVAVPGMRIVIKNTVANKILKIYPATGGAINALAANASLNIAAATSCMLVATSATQWYSLPLLPS
ncbi:MAG TPA: hypothetical protein PLQ89_21690 [Phycisphaerae bacterium]|nr:hypothetical protein [Phycisphaerae bacterium]HOM53896.1 hypothetical protein [Phycisphaerae bacterium]HOQ88325.1 hypothetical protein [Phycisphaerae bacterium]HPP29274.1 hypothetical protein [Phycisphaerae bacterium]HPU28541.1 hypothetical protein [Phycisphaerae bacterium]